MTLYVEFLPCQHQQALYPSESLLALPVSTAPVDIFQARERENIPDEGNALISSVLPIAVLELALSLHYSKRYSLSVGDW